MAAEAWSQLVYSDEAVVIGRPLFVPYATPGIDLGRLYAARLREHVETHGALPQLVLLGNHGIVAIAPTADGVEAVSTMAVKGARVRSDRVRRRRARSARPGRRGASSSPATTSPSGAPTSPGGV